MSFVHTPISVPIRWELETVSAEEDILPAFAGSTEAIVFSSSDHYAPFCAVTLQSLLEQSEKERQYDIFILTTGVSRDQREMLGSMVAPYDNVSLRLVDMSQLASRYEFFAHPHITKETCFCLMAPWIFSNYTKVIFADSDMIFRADPTQLLALDLTGVYVAATPDIVMSAFLNGYSEEYMEYIPKMVGIEGKDEYFNAGFMVYNCALIRKKFTLEQLCRDASEKKYYLVDQDVLNRFFKGKVYYLGLEWNMPPDSYVAGGGKPGDLRKKEYIQSAPEPLLSAYKKAHSAPKVIHYTDTGKPWLFPDDDLADAFWTTAQRTPFYEVVLFHYMRVHAERRAADLQPMQPQIEYYPQGHLVKRTIKRVALVFFPRGTRRHAFVRKIYRFLRGKKE